MTGGQDTAGAQAPAVRSLPAPVGQDRRAAAAVAALAPNTRATYGSAWRAWEAWATEHGRPVLPARTADVADYLEHRHAGGAAPATVRLDRSAVGKVHRVSGLPDPTDDELCRDVLRRIGREGRERGRGQVAGIGWAQAEAAATVAGNGGGSLRGIRDAAILRLMSDTLARVSEVAALRCADVTADTDTGGGTVLIRAGKSDQQGDGSARYIGPPTLAAVRRYLSEAGHHDGPLFRQVRRGNHPSAAPLAARSIREIVRARAADVDGIDGRIAGHSLRVGSAQELAREGASVTELQQAGGWKDASTPARYTRNEAAARGPVARRRYGIGK